MYFLHEFDRYFFQHVAKIHGCEFTFLQFLTWCIDTHATTRMLRIFWGIPFSTSRRTGLPRRHCSKAVHCAWITSRSRRNFPNSIIIFHFLNSKYTLQITFWKYAMPLWHYSRFQTCEMFLIWKLFLTWLLWTSVYHCDVIAHEWQRTFWGKIASTY